MSENTIMTPAPARGKGPGVVTNYSYVKLDPKTTWLPAGAVIGCLIIVFGFGVAWASKGQDERTQLQLVAQRQASQQVQIDAVYEYMRRNDARWDMIRDDMAMLKAHWGLPARESDRGRTPPSSP